MAFSSNWDEGNPPGSQDISLGDDRIREFKTAIRERLQQNHHFPTTDDANTGFHELLTMLDQVTDPVQLAGALLLYAKATGGSVELFTRHATQALQQITKNGKIWIPSLIMDLQAKGDLAYFDGMIWNRFVLGTALQQIRVNADGTNLEYFDNNVPVGSLLQTVNTLVTTSSSGSTVIPLDNTKPQISEGDQVMSLAITPANVNNKLKITVSFGMVTNGAGDIIVANLYQDSTADPLMSHALGQGVVNNGNSFTFYMTAGTIAATTFSVRIGASSGTTYFNRREVGDLYGGALTSSITIQEFKS